MIDAYRHESAVLAGEHTLLEIGKATGVGHWLAVPIVDTRLVLTTSGRIDQLQIFFMLHQSGVGCLMQASSCHRAATMLTYRISCW